MERKAIQIHKADNVAVALNALAPGEEVGLGEVRLAACEEILPGHKIALQAIKKGEPVIKYGSSIGYAMTDIGPGQWVHTHNLKTGLGDLLEYQYQPVQETKMKCLMGYFKGFRRENGKVGIRNEIWIVPTVGCVNSVVRALERQAAGLLYGSVEGVAAFPHPYGCSQMGQDQEHTRTILADLIGHPNAGGVLVVGLGCENSNIEALKPYLGNYNKKRVKFLACQECQDEMKEGLWALKELVEYASGFHREDIGARELVVGLKCGGSDGLSGITANPLVGRFTDMLTGQGGTAILTEVPEMFGAETLLMNRCRDREVFEKTVSLVNDFKRYFKEHNQTIYENPSPGNKKGGISTLEDKSLGCTQKSGSGAVTGVLSYGETAKEPGLNLLSAPGNDLVAATALSASGAHLVLFTTGRGTPFGAPVPTVKISSNTPLAGKKKNWIDFDAGTALEQEEGEELARELFAYVLQVASGRKVKSEEAGFRDMAIFKQGVTL